MNTLTFLFVKMKLVQVFKKKKKSLMKLKVLVVRTVYRQQNIILEDIASFGQKASDRLVLFLWHQGCIFLIILSGSQVPTLFYPRQRLLAFSFTWIHFLVCVVKLYLELYCRVPKGLGMGVHLKSKVLIYNRK